VPSFEQVFDPDEPLHLFIIVRHPLRFAPEPLTPGQGTTIAPTLIPPRLPVASV
jgi:hypothetical protein